MLVPHFYTHVTIHTFSVEYRAYPSRELNLQRVTTGHSGSYEGYQICIGYSVLCIVERGIGKIGLWISPKAKFTIATLTK